jgi:CheY-like chemotaxis protein
MLKYRFGLQSDAAYSGFDGIRLIENRYEKLHRYDCSEKYQLILTDINMPEMDGIQMTKSIRSLIRLNEE